MTGLEFRTWLAFGAFVIVVLLILPALILAATLRSDDPKRTPLGGISGFLTTMALGVTALYVVYFAKLWDDNQHIVMLFILPAIYVTASVAHVLCVAGVAILMSGVQQPSRGMSGEMYACLFFVLGWFWLDVAQGEKGFLRNKMKSYQMDSHFVAPGGAETPRANAPFQIAEPPAPMPVPATKSPELSAELLAEIGRLERLYPQIAPGNPRYDQALIDRSIARRDELQRAGYDQVAATRQAVYDLLGTDEDRNPRMVRDRSTPTVPDQFKGKPFETRPCQFKAVMTDEDYRKCGVAPPSTER